MAEFFRSLITVTSYVAIPLVLVMFLGWGLVKKVKVYEVFVEGAKDGFNVAIRIIPYLVAMLAAIGISGPAVRWRFSRRCSRRPRR